MTGSVPLLYAVQVQLELPFFRVAAPTPPVRLEFVRVRRARKYILRVRPDGTLRVTIPRGGSRREAEAFIARHAQWAERERVRVAALHAPVEWHEGDSILLHGEPTVLRVTRRGSSAWLHLGDERVPISDAKGPADLRTAAHRALRQMATRTLIPRLLALAAAHGLTVARVNIRNQRTRWGSCSPKGAIALNFRLVQMPPHVAEYVLLHELMHLRHQNHSRRYWRLVEQVCPDFRNAERWLRQDGRSLF